MHVTRFTEVAPFYQRAAPFLLAHEAAHNLILGLCADIQSNPARYTQPPYMAVVEEAGVIVQAALMTPPHNLVLSQRAAAGALELLADDIRSFTALPPGVSGPLAESTAFAALWARQTGVTAQLHRALRIYQLTAVIPVAGIAGTMCMATNADRALLLAWFAAFEHEALGEHDPASLDRRLDAFLDSNLRGLMLWIDNAQPVAMAGYSGPTPNSMRVVAVYTPPEQRRHGYASALVAALSQRLLDQGRQFCTLFTDLSNPTSNRIYQQIGYQPVIDVNEWRFVAAQSGDC